MDLWDLTRLLLRRWYFAVPLLLATFVMVFLVTQTVEPDYKAKGYLQLIPPPGSDKPVDPLAPPRPRNPWLDLGYQALGNASLLKVTDQSTLEQLAKEGYTPSVTVFLSDRSPLLEIEAVGTSQVQATATVRKVIELLTEDVAEKQRPYRVRPEDTITTLPLGDGSDVEVVTSKVKRVLVVAAGVGLLITAAGTISADALLRRRPRRRLGLDASDIAPPPADGAGPDPNRAMPRRGVGEYQGAASSPPPGPTLPVLPFPPASGPGNAPARSAGGAGGVYPTRSQTESANESPVRVEFMHRVDRPSPANDAVTAPVHQPNGGSESADLAPDATVVLPLSNSDRKWRDDRTSGR